MNTRDIFADIFAGEANPMEAARRNMRPALRKRFYRRAEVREDGGGFAVTLDSKPVLTPARRTLIVPTRALAEAIAAEWQAQENVIDPARMPLTRLANTIIDGVAEQGDEVVCEIAKYLGSDLLFYRAGDPQRLVECQAQHWDPVIGWARDVLGARFILSEGIMYTSQPEAAIAAARSALPNDPWRLGALHSVTTLTGSALLALALLRGALDVEAVWAAAHVDEDWNMEQWGRDELALERRAFRFAEMRAAAIVLECMRP
jgi:chaperone required for assembly of F1-ATPase